MDVLCRDNVVTESPMLEIESSAINVYADPGLVSPGQRVVYLGDLVGGPPIGSSGLLTKKLGSRAIVDMGYTGVWHVPYFLLRSYSPTN